MEAAVRRIQEKDCVAPPGSDGLCAAFPALTRWATFCRPAGLGREETIHLSRGRLSRNLVSYDGHTAGRRVFRESGMGTRASDEKGVRGLRLRDSRNRHTKRDPSRPHSDPNRVAEPLPSG